MKKILITLALITLIMSCSYASNYTITINNVDFSIPSEYQGGKMINGNYKLENIFSISCIDENVPSAIGLWATEKDFSEEMVIDGHPVRHYYAYNEYAHENISHAYFASGESVYEIKWTNNKITSDIEKLIKNTPQSKIDEDTFYNTLDKSINIYKEQKIDKLNQDSQFNYLETKYNSYASQQNKHDDTTLNRILLSCYTR